MSESWRTTHVFPVHRPDGRGFAIFAFCSLIGTCLLTIANLTIFERTGGVSKLARIMWIGMVLFMVVAGIRDAGGLTGWVSGQVSLFAQRNWVRIVRMDSEPASISIGCSLGRLDFEWFRIEISIVTKLNWNSGQASAMLGHDANDWHMALWYRKNVHAQASRVMDEDSEELVLIGPQGSKAETAELGDRFARFLVDAGIAMFPVSESEYVRVSNEEPLAYQQPTEKGHIAGRTPEMKPGSS